MNLPELEIGYFKMSFSALTFRIMLSSTTFFEVSIATNSSLQIVQANLEIIPQGLLSALLDSQ
jgi:hypothetical protein